MLKRGIIYLVLAILLFSLSIALVNAQFNPGTCKNPKGGTFCGGYASGYGCYCDSYCLKAGDCCDDFDTVCLNEFKEATKEATKCGNGIIDPGESCDGSNLAGNTCQSLGYASGTLQCNKGCQFYEGECLKDELITEEVKCVFKGSTKEQECSSGEKQVGCKGVETCGTVVKGKLGEQVTWKSSCGGYAYTTIDGVNDYAYFDCSSSGGSVPQPPFNVQVSTATDEGKLIAKLEWKNVNGVSFKVYKNKNDGGFVFLYGTKDKSYKDSSGLSKDTKYGYYVTALNDYGESTPSSKVYVYPCTDSDGGKNYYVKGKSSDYGTPQPVEDSCKQDGVTLVEYSCTGQDAGGNTVLNKESYTCPNGCQDGACISLVINNNIGSYTILSVEKLDVGSLAANGVVNRYKADYKEGSHTVSFFVSEYDTKEHSQQHTANTVADLTINAKKVTALGSVLYTWWKGTASGVFWTSEKFSVSSSQSTASTGTDSSRTSGIPNVIIQEYLKKYNSDLPAADTTPPVRSGGSPTGNFPAGTNSVGLSLNTNEKASCRYSATANTELDSMTLFSSTGGTSHSTHVTGLSNGNIYTYYVRCRDDAGNNNNDDYVITFSVAYYASGTETATLIASINNAYAIDKKFTLSASAESDKSVFVYVEWKILPDNECYAVFNPQLYGTKTATSLADITCLKPGLKTITVTFKDNHDNQVIKAINVYVNEKLENTVTGQVPAGTSSSSSSSTGQTQQQQQSQQLGSCQNRCGDYNIDAECQCDEFCTGYGDCCLDKTQYCG